MTIKEFNSTGFHMGMKVKYKGEVRNLVSVNFDENLIGLEDEESECEECGNTFTEIYWVRCENCQLLED